MSRHICFRCEGRHAEFCGSSRFTILFWDDALRVLESYGLANPFRFLPDDALASGADLHGWLESVGSRLAAVAGDLPMLHQIWRVRADGETWQSDAGYFYWRGVPHMVDFVYEELVVFPLDDAQLQERRPDIPYELPVLDDASAEIVPVGDVERDGTQRYRLSAAGFEKLFQGTALWLEHGAFLEFLRREFDEARAAARHAAEAGEQVVLYTY